MRSPVTLDVILNDDGIAEYRRVMAENVLLKAEVERLKAEVESLKARMSHMYAFDEI